MTQHLDNATFVASALERYAYEYRQNIGLPHFLRSRKIVIEYLLNKVRPDAKILDINCGTGIDVVEIAKYGHEAVGIDISKAMISFAAENIAKAGLNSKARAEVCDYRELPSPSEPFDAVLSNFGGINFAENLEPVFSSIDRSLNEGGILLVNSVSHFCLMEILIFLISGKFSKAFRRLTGGKAMIGGKWVQLFYHKKSDFVKSGRKFGFELVDFFGLNIFSPPLWADDFFKSHWQAAMTLENIDNKIRRVPMFRAMGDFNVFVFRKGTQFD